MKFTKGQEGTVEWDGLKGFVYNTKEQFPNASAISFEVTKSHGKTMTHCSDRVYLITGGSGRFVIAEEEFIVTQEDVIIVPKETPYDYFADRGETLKLFLVHTPAFDRDKEGRVAE